MDDIIMITKTQLKKYYKTRSYWGHYNKYDYAVSDQRTDSDSCLGRFFNSQIGGRIRDTGGHCWSMIEVSNCEYMRPYIDEIVQLFKPMVDAEIIDYKRVVYKITKGDAKEPIHALNVFLRHTWEKVLEWPIQETPPTAKEVWLAHLDKNEWGRAGSGYDTYISHSNFNAATHTSQALGITREQFVVEMYDLVASGMAGLELTDCVPSYGDPIFKSKAFKCIVEKVQARNPDKILVYDPFRRE